MRIALFGPPGVGKGTQAGLIVQRKHIVQISTGNLIRAAMAEGTQAGLAAESFVVAGRLVPDEIVRVLAEDAIALHGFDDFVLDGYPRTVRQAEWLTDFLLGHEKPLEAVVSLVVADDQIVDRLSRRRVHRTTGEVFHLDFRPPPVDLDPTLLTQRRDDHPEAIRERLRVYTEQTNPVEQYYADLGLLHRVDGVGDVEEIYSRVAEVVSLACTNRVA